tara:strand:+ start:228 stop:485 length:258 start_codon:yes stop_codon:yes gene_type:complete
MSDDETYYREQLYKNMKRRVIHDYSNEQRITDILEEKSADEKDEKDELEFDYEPSNIPTFVKVIAGFLAVGLFVGVLYVFIQYLK